MGEELNTWTEKVLEFHRGYEVDYHFSPMIPDKKRADLRISLIEEEVKETIKAIKDGDLTEIADGICDSIYVLLGTAWEYGLGPKMNELFAEVHRSNMSKLHDGKVVKREDGKVLKGPNYSPADLHSIINK